jgi:hypothetical protein
LDDTRVAQNCFTHLTSSTAERQWRHLNTSHYQPILPWAEQSGRFTVPFEARAFEWLKAARQKAVARLLKLAWDEIHGRPW